MNVLVLYYPLIVYFVDSQKKRGYTDAMSHFVSRSVLDPLEPYFAVSPTLVSGANYADIHTYLPDDLMVKVDVAVVDAEKSHPCGRTLVENSGVVASA